MFKKKKSLKKRLLENIITSEKCLIGIDYVQPSLPFGRIMLGTYFALETAIETTIRGSFLEVDVSQGEG